MIRSKIRTVRRIAESADSADPAAATTSTRGRVSARNGEPACHHAARFARNRGFARYARSRIGREQRKLNTLRLLSTCPSLWSSSTPALQLQLLALRGAVPTRYGGAEGPVGCSILEGTRSTDRDPACSVLTAGIRIDESSRTEGLTS